MRRSLLSILLFAAPALLAAQEKPALPMPTSGIRADAKSFTLPEGKIGIEDLIDAAAHFLGRNILANPNEMMAGGQNNSFVLQKPITTDQHGCEDLLYGLLYIKGYAVVPIDASKGVYEVISMNGQRGREVSLRPTVRSVEEVTNRPTLKEFVLVTVPLQHINAQVATNALRPFFASAGNGSTLTIGNVGNNTSILLMGFGDQVASAIHLLQECDRAAPAEAQTPGLAERVANLEQALAQLRQKLDATGKDK